MNLNFMEMVGSYQKGEKTLGEKKKLLVMSNFSFSCIVFKRLILKTCKNKGLFRRGLKYCREKKP